MKRLAAVVACFCIALSGCKPAVTQPESPESSWETSNDSNGAPYIADLAKAIRTADRIVVTEHSNDYDFVDPARQETLAHTNVTYRRVELSPAQRVGFARLVEDLKPAAQTAETACIFEPHHTIAFYRDDKLVSEMKVCFKCYQVEWDATEHEKPWSIHKGLKVFVTSIGMEPERDWYALAHALLKP